MISFLTVSLEMNSLRKGRYYIIRRPINELAFGGPGCLWAHTRWLHGETSVKPTRILRNGQSFKQSFPVRSGPAHGP